MTALITKLFVKNPDSVSSQKTRMEYTRMCSLTGIFCNIALSALKLTAGSIVGSVSVAADGLNNLADCASCLILLFGARMSAKKPDSEHPFGHGRIEYVTGLVIAFAVLLMGVELSRSSIESIIGGNRPEYGDLTLILLAVSALVKFWMFFFYRKAGGKISSKPLIASSTDSISDAISTGAVLTGALLARYAGLTTDGWLGLAVAVFILWSGIRAVRDTVSPLLGDNPDPELVGKIEDIMRSDGTVLDIHDLVVHDYGPGRRMASVHAEVPADRSIIEIHDAIDDIESRIESETGCEITVHMDPVDRSDPRFEAASALVRRVLGEIDQSYGFHDLETIRKGDITVLLFDVAIPAEHMNRADQIGAQISNLIQKNDKHMAAIVKVEPKYK